MNNKLIEKLAIYKKSTVSLDELETLSHSYVSSYGQFAESILSLEDKGILEMVKSKGRNHRSPSLAFRYRIQKQHLKNDYHQLIKNARLNFHSSVQLDIYYSLDPSQWQKDVLFLEKINAYIVTHGFPLDNVPAPERSVELVGDEKWVTDKGGKELLERVQLWDRMKIIPVSDPLMFAVNPVNLARPHQAHLIVENKTTYQALLYAFLDTSFSTLIYGSGNKIVKSMEQFDSQLPLQNVTHHFYYFGDLDHEGLSIWARLAQKYPVGPALPFYKACLSKKALKGKTNQRVNKEALLQFNSYFTITDQMKINELLKSGRYYPQEVLKTKELQDIWRQWQWTQENKAT